MEDKFDAKNLWTQPVALRCSPPPSKKRVPLQFDAWVVLLLGVKAKCQGISSKSLEYIIHMCIYVYVYVHIIYIYIYILYILYIYYIYIIYIIYILYIYIYIICMY